LTHLYYKNSLSKQIFETLNAFESCESIDISKTKTLNQDEIYLVEIDKIEKSLLLHIKNLLLPKTQSIIYFFINDSHNLMLFQLASLLKVTSIITPKHESTKIISSIKNEFSLKQTQNRETSIAKTLSSAESFMVFDKDGLKFASEKLHKEFDCNDLEMVKSKICLNLDLTSFLKKNHLVKNSFDFGASTKEYEIKSLASTYNDEIYIYIKELKKQNLQLNSSIEFIKNRIYFIEVLKEKILEKSISQSLLSIITIQVENMDNLRQHWSEYEIEMAIRDLLLQVEIEISSHTILAQYDDNLYVTLFEGLDFVKTKQKANTIQNHISLYSSKQEIKPVIGLYAYDINDLELNNILSSISDISKESVSKEDIQSNKLYRVVNINDELDDARAIDILLQTTFTNNTPIKLLNIYKGLCINTASSIMKKIDQEIYVNFEQLQGTVMQFEKETAIQSPTFAKDISADVAHIDSKKKIAILKNFQFVKGSANARKYSRVIPSQRTPISILHKSKGTLSGEILDISMNSIAIKTRLHKNIETLKHNEVILKFTLPISNAENGFMQLSLTADIMFSMCDTKYCKVVVNLQEDQTHESILMEYVYNRQKEIIVELKKQTSFLN
jgi:hypothetical protein